MLPTSTQLNKGSSWLHPPNFDYSFKHSLHWPQGAHPGATAEAAQAAHAAAHTAHTAHAAQAAGAEAAHFAAGGVPPRGPGMHYHWYGRGHPGYHRRYGGGKRFFWFALGIGATALYYRHKERRREWEHAIASGQTPKEGFTGGCDNAWGHGWHYNTWATDTVNPPHYPSIPAPTAPVQQTQQAPAVQPSLRETPAEVAAESAVLAALKQQSAQTAEPVKADDAQHRRMAWGWGERRRRREAARKEEEARALASSAAVESANMAGVGSSDEMKRLREVVEDLWAERKTAAAAAQEEANERAKEYAREKIDRLSVALESLRESLRTEREKDGEKKLV